MNKGIKIVSLLVIVFLIGINILFYKFIKSPLPGFRGVTFDKDIFIASRIQIINIVSIIALLLLLKIFENTEKYLEIQKSLKSFIMLAWVKSLLELAGHFSKNVITNSIWMIIPILVVVIFEYVRTKETLKEINWKLLEIATRYKIAFAVLLTIYLFMNVPLMFYHT